MRSATDDKLPRIMKRSVCCKVFGECSQHLAHYLWFISCATVSRQSMMSPWSFLNNVSLSDDASSSRKRHAENTESYDHIVYIAIFGGASIRSNMS
jgi:hypothetical protein